MQELFRPDKQHYNRLLLETWLNEVLHDSTAASSPTKEQAPYKVCLLPSCSLILSLTVSLHYCLNL